MSRPPLAERVLQPFVEFAHRESTSGPLLIACTVVALVWGNSPWAEAYARVWSTSLTIGVSDAAIRASLLHWINDGLMAVLFLLVGLEINWRSNGKFSSASSLQ